MKTRTEKILMVMKILAYMGGIGFSIDCGSQLLSLAASFINPEWAKRVLNVDQGIFSLRDRNIWFYVYAIGLVIALSAMKATVWYVVADLLMKLKLKHPIHHGCSEKIRENCLLAIWNLDNRHYREDVY